MRYDEILDLILETTEINIEEVFTEDGSGFMDYKNKLSSIMSNLKKCQSDIKDAKKNKDYTKLKKISGDIDEQIKEIEKFRSSLDYNQFPNVDQAVSVLKGITTVCKVIVAIIGSYYVYDALKLTEMEMNEVTRETSNLSDLMSSLSNNLRSAANKFKGNSSNKTVAKVSVVTGGLAGVISEQDRRKLMGTFDNAMSSLDKIIKKYKKLNKNIQSAISKADSKSNKSESKNKVTKESVNSIKLEIYESELNGEISKNEREFLMNLI